ncbi:MAG: adenylyltransferase/cytidyltransferase family protein [Planctomycetes bacterium]|nr:adenylyltransferase/cytidyltransferase family protein [Planctomycetota bacterium]
MPPDFQKKIVSDSELQDAVTRARKAGKTVVQCHGCFDIVHPGHIRYLEFARKQGDVLVVSVTGDCDITKGNERPYIPQELRAENLAALVFVDFVHVTSEPTAEAVLALVKPDIYVKGREYERSHDPGFLAEKKVVEHHGGRIIFSSGEIVFSSTKLIERIPQTSETESSRVNLACKRHDISLSPLEESLRHFRDLRVLVVGDIVMDRYVQCDAMGIASESPVISLAQRDERTYVGGAAIVARHIAALGAHPFLLSAGADDDQTVHAEHLLHGEGVETHLIKSRPALALKTRFLVDETKVFKVDCAQRLPLDSVAEKQAALILEQQSKIADAVIFCDFGYGMLTGSLLERVLPTLRQNVKFISADISGGRASLLSFRFADLLCPTEREARAMLNDHDSGLSAAAWRLLQETQARHLFITLEKRGLVVFERRSQDRSSPEWAGRLKSEQLPSLADHAIDRLGCGDALLAAATLSLTAGDSLMQAAYLGSAAAAIEVSMLGNHPVEIDLLRDWLQSRRELQTPIHNRPAAAAAL